MVLDFHHTPSLSTCSLFEDFLMSLFRSIFLARNIFAKQTIKMASNPKKIEPGLLGAIVGDAATMPVHWIYDETKLRDTIEIANISSPEFNSALSCPFYSSKEFPGHYDTGSVSPYGEQFLALLDSTRSNNGDVEKTSQDFYDWLATYSGRKDHAGNEFFKNFGEGKRNPESGADDAQAQCLSKAVIAVSTGHEASIKSFISFHQNNETAIGCGELYAKFLQRMKSDKLTARESFDQTFVNENESLPKFVKPHIEFLLRYIESSDTRAMLKAWTEEFNEKPFMALSCLCPPAMLRSIHISVHATSYEQGLRENMLIGGDNCAALAYKFEIPEEWMKQVKQDIFSSL